MNPDLEKYHKSIGQELLAVKDRVRNLIAMANPGEDGRYKEEVLKRVIRNHLPEQLSLGTGFILGEQPRVTKQIDIIIYDTAYPVLFRNSDFVILTGEGVKGIIEVKTSLNSSTLKTAVNTASNNGITAMSGHVGRLSFFNGLFSYAWEGTSFDPAFDAIKTELRTNFNGPEKAWVLQSSCLGPDALINIFRGELTYNDFPELAMSAFLFDLFRILCPNISQNTQSIYFDPLQAASPKRREPIWI
jgi:hypothetical protein